MICTTKKIQGIAIHFHPDFIASHMTKRGFLAMAFYLIMFISRPYAQYRSGKSYFSDGD